MKLGRMANRLAAITVDTTERGLRGAEHLITNIAADSACNTIKSSARAAVIVTLTSLFGVQPARAQEKDASIENGKDTYLTGHLGPADYDESFTSGNDDPCPVSPPGTDGRRQLSGTCVFVAQGNNGNRFKIELQDAEALMDNDLNVELKVGGIRGIEGVENPPKITVCGSKHCMDANIDSVGWVLRTDDNNVQVKSQHGEVLVTTTYDIAKTLNEGDWVNVELGNPDGSNMPSNCAIRWTGETGQGSDTMLATMASLLYLELMRRRRKKKK